MSVTTLTPTNVYSGLYMDDDALETDVKKLYEISVENIKQGTHAIIKRYSKIIFDGTNTAVRMCEYDIINFSHDPIEWLTPSINTICSYFNKYYPNGINGTRPWHYYTGYKQLIVPIICLYTQKHLIKSN